MACNVRIDAERWEPVSVFEVAEAAAVAVGRRKTGIGEWDKLGFAPGISFDLSTWKTEPSEGAQDDASVDGSGDQFGRLSPDAECGTFTVQRRRR